MLIEISLQDLMLFILCALGITAGILLIPILWNIKKIVGVLLPIVVTNQESIKHTVKSIPVIVENLEKISTDTKETANKLKLAVPPILQEIGETASATKESIGMAGSVIENLSTGIGETLVTRKKEKADFMDYVHVIEEIVQIIYRTFSAGK